MDQDPSLNSNPNTDAVEMLVDFVFRDSIVKKRRVSAIMDDLHSASNSPDNDKKKFLDDLAVVLDPDKIDAEVPREHFSTVCKKLYDKHQENTDASPRTSPVKFFQDFSPVKHESFGHSVTESETSYCSSPTSDIYLENSRLQDECHGLKFRLNLLEDQNQELEKLLFKSEEKCSDLDNRNKDLESLCRELEDFKTKYGQLLYENNNGGGDAKVDESRINKLKHEITRLKEDLMNAVEESRLKDLEIEDLQSHGVYLHKDFENISERLKEKELCLEQKEQEIDKFKTDVMCLSETIKNISEENETLKEAAREISQHRSVPITVDDSLTEENFNFRPMCLKDELGGSLPALNSSTDLDDSASYLKISTPDTDEHQHSRNYESLCFENNFSEGDAEADEIKIKQVEDEVTRLEAELTEARAQITAKDLALRDVERNAQFCRQEYESIFVRLEEKEKYVEQREQEIANLKLKEETLSDNIKNLEDANEAFKLAMKCNQSAGQENSQQEADSTLRQNPTMHNKWKVYFALVAYLLHNILLGYVVFFLVVVSLSPFLNYNALARAKPWFMSVSAPPELPPV